MLKDMTINRWTDVNVLYQIYPRSFKDVNGDGVGDLAGITEKLDYVSDVLGVDAVWVSPFYPSPQTDCGYDVSDYYGVDPLFGSMADADTFIAAAHAKRIKVMLDLVPNHTSDQHAWFQESRSSRASAKRDWYVWRDIPNNWRSISGGSSWTYDETTGQYYLHSFMPSQPDLNWENLQVRAAMKDVIRFWFSKGVDGFRVDAVWVLSKNTAFPDDPVNDRYEGSKDDFGAYIHRSCKNGPRLVEHLRDLVSVTREYSDKYFLFEYYPDEQLGDVHAQICALHSVAPGLAAPMYFEGLHQPWHAEHVGRTLTDYLRTLPDGVRPSFCFSNHDQPRLVGRYSEAQARLVAFMQMTLPGLPVMYYGDELGMEQVDIAAERMKDLFEKTIDSGGRDPERTPMQWDGSLTGGFTTGTPWLPVPKSAAWKNVDSEYGDPQSWLTLYQQLLQLRREPLWQRGSFTVVDTDTGYVLAYARELDGQRYYVALNYADAAQICALPEVIVDVVAMTHPGAVTVRSDGRVSLEGFGAAVLVPRAGQGSPVVPSP